MPATVVQTERQTVRATSATDALLAACGACLHADMTTLAPGTGALLVTVGAGAELREPPALVDAVRSGRRVVVVAGHGASLTIAGHVVTVAGRPIETSSPGNPLVADTHLDATVVAGPHAGATLTTRDFAELDGGTVLATTTDGHPVAVTFDVDGTAVAVIGSTHIIDDAWLAAGHTADVIAWLLTGEAMPVSDQLANTLVGEPLTRHIAPPVIQTSPDRFDLSLLPSGRGPSDPAFVRAAGHSARLLPDEVHDALVDFADEGHPSGALVVRGVPLGDLPATPERPTAPATKDHVSEFVLLTVARRLGQPIGYLPEHGGDLIQNILPVKGTEGRQVSTSSKVELMFHTEAAFHPHRPRFLLLLCLRGDSNATTTLASIREIVRMLPLGVRRTLFEPRFRTAADESYVGKRPTQLGLAMPVLSGDWDAPNLVFDADLMVGIDEQADAALATLSAAVESCHTGIALEAGDLLVVDNSVAVHGRSPFTPRFDGTDRWLQRTFVVSDLVPSAGEREGRIIATRFAG